MIKKYSKCRVCIDLYCIFVTHLGGNTLITEKINCKDMKKLIQDFKNFKTYEKGGVYFCLLFIVPALGCVIINIFQNLL